MHCGWPGLSYSKEELVRRVGGMHQLAGVRQYTLSDGPERGVRALRLYNAAGLDLEVLADRGMDIGGAALRGIPLTWLSPSAFPHPAYYEPQGSGWLRTFGGGFLITCGLTYHGRPATDQGEALGLHGRASHIPASHVHVDESWRDGEYVISVSGRLRETSVFGPDLVLDRRVHTSLWQAGWTIEDTVTNEGYAATEHMILYHINLGFPLLDSSTKVAIARSATRPRDEESAKGMEHCLEMSPPRPGFREQVFYHDVRPDEYGIGRACVYNPRLADGLALLIEFSAQTLPRLVEWKMMGEGTYVLGIEPGTSFVDGRPAERQAGRVPVLQPQEHRAYRLRFSVLCGVAAREAFERVAG